MGYGLQLHREPKHKSEHNILTVKTESEETQDKTAMMKAETAKIKAEASAEAKRKRAHADLINAQAQKLQAQNTNVAFTKMIQMMKLQQHQEEQEAQQQQQQEKQTMKMMKFMDGMMKRWGGRSTRQALSSKCFLHSCSFLPLFHSVLGTTVVPRCQRFSLRDLPLRREGFSAAMCDALGA